PALQPLPLLVPRGQLVRGHAPLGPAADLDNAQAVHNDWRARHVEAGPGALEVVLLPESLASGRVVTVEAAANPERDPLPLGVCRRGARAGEATGRSGRAA